jgi:hypothetical protein
MVVGAIFVVLGLVFVTPNFGIFGLAWTAVAAVITLYHGYNFFSTRGISTYEVNVKPTEPDSIRR